MDNITSDPLDSWVCIKVDANLSHVYLCMYIQTRSCKPKSGKPKELQTSQVSTSESIFLPEILLFNTPLNLRAKPKALFCIPATHNS